jgi:hypothetical protein
MIKPQARIRPEYVTSLGEDEDMVRVSLDSYGGEVLSREEKGQETLFTFLTSLSSKQLLLCMQIVS